MNTLNNRNLKLKSLSIFQTLHTQPLFLTVQYLLDKSQENDELLFVEAYAKFVSTLYGISENLSDCILNAVLDSENVYVKRCVLEGTSSIILSNELDRELKILEDISCLKPTDFYDCVSDSSMLANWETTTYDFAVEYTQRMKRIHTCGIGIYANYHMFILQDSKISPVQHPDPQQLSEFHEYNRERNLVIQNTLALLNGNKASNILLYGDAGTGKSSTIKAVVNAYAKDGLRLIEVKKNQLYLIPRIIEQLTSNPLKFILFVDDLSFQGNDENFSTLKSILEGSTSAISNNICIYATSNRRHLVKEDHQSRIGDEIHLRDTLQETLSLSSRFGLTITFSTPDKKEYIAIVDEMAKQHGITLSADVLHKKAEAYAILHYGRSPRSAKQFIDLLKNGI